MAASAKIVFDGDEDNATKAVHIAYPDADVRAVVEEWRHTVTRPDAVVIDDDERTYVVPPGRFRMIEVWDPDK